MAITSPPYGKLRPTMTSILSLISLKAALSMTFFSFLELSVLTCPIPAQARSDSTRLLVDFNTQDGTAVDGIDYIGVSGTLVFDEFEMSKTLVIEIIPPFFINFSRDFGVVLSNPRLDPGESPADLPPPRVLQPFATAIVRILADGI